MVPVQTYNVGPEARNDPAIRIFEPREVYARDEFVYWGVRRRWPPAALRRSPASRGWSRFINVEIDGPPRIIGRSVA